MVEEKAIEQIDQNKMVETQELHCERCGRFLCLQAILWGVVKIKCHICKEWNTLDVQPDVEQLDEG